MAIPTAIIPHLLFLLFLLIAAAAPGSSRPAPATGADLIQSQCQLTHYPDLCFASLLYHPGSSNVAYEDMGKLAVGVVFDSVIDTREQLTKMMSVAPDPETKQALSECEKQYDSAIYNLEFADKYMKSDGFEKMHDYNPVFRWTYNAEGYFSKCGAMLEGRRGFNGPLKNRIQIVRQLADNAYQILKYLLD